MIPANRSSRPERNEGPEHPVDPVGLLAHLLEEEERAVVVELPRASRRGPRGARGIRRRAALGAARDEDVRPQETSRRAGARPSRSAGNQAAVSGSRGFARSAATIGPWNETRPHRSRRNAERAVTSEKPQWSFALSAELLAGRRPRRRVDAVPAAREEDRRDVGIADEREVPLERGRRRRPPGRGGARARGRSGRGGPRTRKPRARRRPPTRSSSRTGPESAATPTTAARGEPSRAAQRASHPIRFLGSLNQRAQSEALPPGSRLSSPSAAFVFRRCGSGLPERGHRLGAAAGRVDRLGEDAVVGHDGDAPRVARLADPADDLLVGAPGRGVDDRHVPERLDLRAAVLRRPVEDDRQLLPLRARARSDSSRTRVSRVTPLCPMRLLPSISSATRGFCDKADRSGLGPALVRGRSGGCLRRPPGPPLVLK